MSDADLQRDFWALVNSGKNREQRDFEMGGARFFKVVVTIDGQRYSCQWSLTGDPYGVLRCKAMAEFIELVKHGPRPE